MDLSSYVNSNNIISSQYDIMMIKMYQNLVDNGTLKIISNIQLKSLYFLQSLEIKDLWLYNCRNIIPKLQSETITNLHIIACDFYSLVEFKLNNLEVLEMQSNQKQKEATILVQEIVKFKKLKQLQLERWQVNLNPISMITGITKLSLVSCKLRNTEALRPLYNLVELSLNFNTNIDITSLQHLTRLTKLWLDECGLDNIDALRPLVNLNELIVSCCSIVFNLWRI
ncbi:leucine-rich_repeat-containing protein [Hexamita inflata]|uniref:Leucine-rich repeat-containing protein n=1 Tax=Hexamita inflata TaxID=28002 RepID=A0AA86PKI7_9EUKA|nr:leucine-rich repeat-containing protein [Hexamita inflata]